MNFVDDGKGRKPRQGAFNPEVEVKPQGPGARAGSPTARHPSQRPMFGENLMEEVCDRNNLLAALKRVRQNKGSPGVDGMTLDQLPQFLMESWPRIKAALYQGTYRPKPVKRVEIPKPGGKGREKARSPLCIGPVYTTGGLTGASEEMGSHLFGEQLWFPTEAIRPSSHCESPSPISNRAIHTLWTSTWKSSSIESAMTV